MTKKGNGYASLIPNLIFKLSAFHSFQKLPKTAHLNILNILEDPTSVPPWL